MYILYRYPFEFFRGVMFSATYTFIFLLLAAIVVSVWNWISPLGFEDTTAAMLWTSTLGGLISNIIGGIRNRMFMPTAFEKLLHYLGGLAFSGSYIALSPSSLEYLLNLGVWGWLLIVAFSCVLAPFCFLLVIYFTISLRITQNFVDTYHELCRVLSTLRSAKEQGTAAGLRIGGAKLQAIATLRCETIETLKKLQRAAQNSSDEDFSKTLWDWIEKRKVFDNQLGFSVEEQNISARGEWAMCVLEAVQQED